MMRNLDARYRFILCILPALFGFRTESFGQPLATPNLVAVWPQYGTSDMALTWIGVPTATEYQYRKKINAGPFGSWISASNNTSILDTYGGGTDSVTYQVRAIRAAPPDTSAVSNARTNQMVKVWPVTKSNSCADATSVEVLNGFNQPIDVNYNYLHEGMDLNGELTVVSECVRAPMGGILFGIDGSEVLNQVVNIQVYQNGRLEQLQFNHLINVPASLMDGQSVKPGELLGYITSGYGGWTTESSHTHFHYWTNGMDFWGTTTDPHTVFDDITLKDPKGRDPRVVNTNGDLDSLRFRHGPNGVDYFMKDTVWNAVDIVAEVYDPQSNDAPYQAPKYIGYFIEKHDGSSWSDAVKSAGSPYLLFDSGKGFYQARSSGPPNPAVTSALSDTADVVESKAPHTPSHYSWQQSWCWIPTNCKGTAGSAADLDRMQCWATNARNSVMSDNGYANSYNVARCIEEAKFKDGEYRVNITMGDHRGAASPFSRVINVDNFRPYLKGCKIESGKLKYDASWEWNSGTGQLTLNSNMDMDSVCGVVDVHLTFSEYMKEVTLDVPSIGFVKTSTSPEPGTNQTEWKFTIPSSDIAANANSGPHKLKVTGKDRNSNALQGFASTSPVAGASIYKHKLDGSWDPASAPVPDNVHEFFIKEVPVKMSFQVDSVKCDDSMDGKITVNASEGKPPYQYSRDNGATWQNSNVFSGLGKGPYTIRVMDADSCSASKDTIVPSPAPLNLSVTGGGVFPFCQQDGPPTITLVASASGGTSPYTYSPASSITVSSSGIRTFTVTDKNGCNKFRAASVVFIPVLCSRDPNDMIGPPGYGDAKWVSKFDNLPYTIRFENDPEFATAPAQKVVVEHVPDEDINLYSFRLGDFGFANQTFSPPANATFYNERLDLVDSLGVLVDVTAGIDVTANKVFWIFQALDPATLLPPNDPLLGMLPVNDTLIRNGEGFVNFTIKPRNSAVTGDSILAESAIVFDVNDTIVTPRIFNTIDALPPVSSITGSLPPYSDSTSFQVNWQAEDDPGGCGIRDYTLYYSTGGGAFLPYQEGIEDTFLVFTGTPGQQYGFFTRAYDNVGNAEPLKSAAEVQTTIRESSSLKVFSQSSSLFCPGDSLTIQWNTTGLTRVKVLLSTDGGASYSTLAADLPAQPGIYTWHSPAVSAGCATCRLMVRDTAGTLAAVRDSVTFAMHASPAVDAGPNATTCQDEPLQLQGSGAVSYAWSPAAGLSSTAVANPVATLLSSQTYHLLGTDANGCRNTDSVSIAVLLKDSTQIMLYTCDPAQEGVEVDTFSNQQGCDSLVFSNYILIPNNLTISNPALPSGIYRSNGQLTAVNTTVAAGLNVSFRSNGGILLQGEFTVVQGAVFEAIFEACPVNANGFLGLKALFKKLKGKKGLSELPEEESSN